MVLVFNLDFVFLQGRCFWFASRFSSVLPSALISNLITWGVEALSQKNHFLNVFVIKGIKLFIENTTVTQHIPQIIDSLSRVLSFSIESQDELITICLDTISTSLLKTNQVSIFESTIIPLLIKVWAKLSDDVLVAEIIHETMSLFIKSPNSNFIPDFLDFVCKLLDCGLINMTRVSNETVFDVSGVFIEKEHVFSMVPLSFDLLCDIIDNSAVVPASFVQVVFPIVIQILLVSDNISILQVSIN